jgi:hypothetical protein
MSPNLSILVHLINTQTWYNVLEQSQTNPNGARPVSTLELYNLSCRESNISPGSTYLHRHLNFRPPNDDDLQPASQASFSTGMTLPGLFERMPLSFAVGVLRHLLVFPGELVHCISRLDPHVALTEVPRNTSGDPSLLHRFAIGQRKLNISLTHATHPQELLAIFCVCKTFNFLGSHLFFSQNVFVFSSLGE